MKPSRARPSLVAMLLLVALTVAACGGGDDESNSNGGSQAVIDPAQFSAKVDHPLVPLSSVPVTDFEGSEGSGGKTVETRGENRLLDRTERIAGVDAAIVEVKEYEDGELVERTLDYYAQRKDGSVWYMGERVDEYKNGKVTGHEGEWLAGEGGAKPGPFMPAKPKVGQTFEQERAPGVAEDRSTVVDDGLAVTTAAGKFDDCIKTRDFGPLDNSTEFKYYCDGVGLVREEKPGGRNRFDLVRYSRAPAAN